jgi:hypothetical protein
LTAEQRSHFSNEFLEARRHGLFMSRYATLNEEEFLAELSQAYFDVAPNFCTRPQLARVDRHAFLQLAKIYSLRALESRPAPPPNGRPPN